MKLTIFCLFLFVGVARSAEPEVKSLFFHVHQATGHLEQYLRGRCKVGKDLAKGHLKSARYLQKKHHIDGWENIISDTQNFMNSKKVKVSDLDNLRLQWVELSQKQGLSLSDGWQKLIRQECKLNSHP